MKTFAMICFLVPLLLVEQLRCAEGERHRLRRRRRESPQPPYKASSHSAATAYFSRISPISGPETCKDEEDSSHDREPRHWGSHSLSPWKYKICTDPTRYPPSIRIAECLRRDCDYPGTESFPKLRIRLISIPLKHTIDVWYRRQTGGHNHITRARLDVPIGCTCVKERRLSH